MELLNNCHSDSAENKEGNGKRIGRETAQDGGLTGTGERGSPIKVYS